MANYYIKKINGYLVKDEEARQQISQLDDQLYSVSGDLSNLTTNVGNLATDVQDLDQDIRDIGQDVNKNTQDIAQLKTDLDETYDDALSAMERANEAYALAEGRNSAHVFDNEASMKSALKGADKVEYGIGDHLLIKATNEPDYWISNVLETNEGEYGYYEVSILETEKVDLSGYVTSAGLTTTLGSYAKTNGNYSSMTVGKAGSATSAGKVTNKLTINVGGVSLTSKEYDGSSAVTIGDINYPIANAVQAEKATKATGDEDGTNIKTYYAKKTYADAYNITFSVANEELTILKNTQYPFKAPTE